MLINNGFADVETKRLCALRELNLLDTPTEIEFDELVHLAAGVCGTPISMVSLIDEDRQWFKATFGCKTRETLRRGSFCELAIQQKDLFVVEDATRDPRFFESAMVTGDPKIRFYAGMPLFTPSGHAIGTLCVIDTVARTLTDMQREALLVLAKQVCSRMEMRLQQRVLECVLKEKEKIAAGLRASEERFRLFMDQGPFVSYMKDAAGRMLYYNEPFAKNFNVSMTEWLGRSDHEIWPDEMATLFQKHDREVVLGGIPIELTEEAPGPCGTSTYWKSYKFPCKDENGNQLLAGISLDITKELKREQALELVVAKNAELAAGLESSQLLFQAFMDHSPFHSFLKSEDGRYIFYNVEFAKFFGIDKTAWIGRRDDEMQPKEMAEKYRQNDLLALASDLPLETHTLVYGAARTPTTFRVLKFSYKNLQGEKMLAGVAVDVTKELDQRADLEKANVLLREMAITDSLTGLRNRRAFPERVEVEFSRAQRSRRPLSVMMIDVDNFKARNDQWGHDAGDTVLRKLGEILNGTVRLEDVAVRYGGEEFAIILPETDAKGAGELADRLMVKIGAEPWEHAPVTVSIGISSLEPAIVDGAHLVRMADKALYAAKHAGKNRAMSSSMVNGTMTASATPPVGLTA